ncbi:MAG: DUF433 domain-containing protein [Bacteroidetes bacterium]|jgi:uncharacterized protein (DUF433 family)|nr:DUF433 domain-containing protein [Bacteroidota bacterium]
MPFDRITSDPAILSGTPHIKGTRISVAMVLDWIAGGASVADICATYPHLRPEDVEQAIRYAARFLENEVVIATEAPE